LLADREKFRPFCILEDAAVQKKKNKEEQRTRRNESVVATGRRSNPFRQAHSRWHATACAAVLLAATQDSVAQTTLACTQPFEGHHLRWIVPYAVGGGYEMYSRLLAPYLEDALGAAVIVESIPSAGGTAGARAIKHARPDGLTIGIVNLSGLLVAAQTGLHDVPDPTRDFTILGRITDSRQVWVTNARSGLRNMSDVIDASDRRPLIFGVRDFGTGTFLNIVVTAELLDLNIELVAGYAGTADSSLAAIRGDVDMIAGNFESLLQWIDSGDLRPILQISDERISPHRSLEAVPTLGGERGWAELRAADRGRAANDARADATALAALLAGARLVVAPLGVDESLATCLQQALSTTLADERLGDLAARAGLALRPGAADEARAAAVAAAEAMQRFAPTMREASLRFSE
jgi:tripartite-type tricarboxylate transporter receptor subunit TctC